MLYVLYNMTTMLCLGQASRESLKHVLTYAPDHQGRALSDFAYLTLPLIYVTYGMHSMYHLHPAKQRRGSEREVLQTEGEVACQECCPPSLFPLLGLPVASITLIPSLSFLIRKL